MEIHSDCGSKNPLYQTWYLMMYRCYNPKYYKYHRYGGRGITVCAEWHSFANFIKDMQPTYLYGHTLDRRNNDGNYEPSNCCWITREDNSKKDTSKGVYQYSLEGTYVNSYDAASDANQSLGLNKENGGLNRAISQKKPYKGYRWSRLLCAEGLPAEEMTGKLINTNMPIKQIDLNTLEVIKVWSNAKEIVETLKINSGSLSRVCSGKLNKTGGFKWEYASSPNC